MSVEYTGAGGVRQHYGPRDSGVDADVGSHSTYGEVQELVVNFTYDDLPSVQNAGNDASNSYVPANSYLLDAYVYVSTDFNSTSGTTTVDIGLEKADGTDINADAIGSDFVTADGSNAGWVTGAGDGIGAGIGADDGYIVVAPSTADLTAGEAKLVVRYIRNV